MAVQGLYNCPWTLPDHPSGDPGCESTLLCPQALSNVPPLRNYFLEEENYRRIQRPPGDIMFLLVQRFGELMRKLWNPRNFKAHVSPHEMLQAVVLCSKKNFQITKQGDGVEFLSWFLNALHAALGGTKRKKKSECGEVLGGPQGPLSPF